MFVPAYLAVLLVVGVQRRVVACPPPAPNICQSYHDPNNLLKVHDTYSGWCVCVEEYDDVCFPFGTSFSVETEAYYKNTDTCNVLCAMSDNGEVCATQCSIPEDDYRSSYKRLATFDDNQECSVETETDECCPERGELCSGSAVCKEPRCSQTYTSTGCLLCGCFNPSFLIPNGLCLFDQPCTFHNIHFCCDAAYERCSIFGDDVESVFPSNLWYVFPPFPQQSLVDSCGGFPFDIRTCKGVITSDENCCPLECVVPCDCAPLNEANAADWNLILQQGNGQNPTDILKSSPDSLHVGGPRRLFFNRVDEEAFCLSKITLEVKCARRVYIKINFKNALSQQFDVNIPAGSQSAFSTVTLGPYTHEDVASVRIGFNSANNGCGPILANELVMSPCEDTP